MNYQFTFANFYPMPEDPSAFYATTINPDVFYAEMPSQTTFNSFPSNQFCYFPGLVNDYKQNGNQYRPTEAQQLEIQPQIQSQQHPQYYGFVQNIPSIAQLNQQNNHINIQQQQDPVQIVHLKKTKVKIHQPSLTKNQKKLKKNTQSNLINNIFSYISSKLKSQRLVQKILESPEQVNIFYIFVNNMKKLNGRYVNRKNIKAICDIQNKKQHDKMLAKSVKRLLVLPVHLLRKVLRCIIFSYLRGANSLLPLLTSKKISKIAIKQHLQKRRQLVNYLVQNILEITE